MRRTRDAAPLAADEGAKQGQPGGMQPTQGPAGELRRGNLRGETSRSDQHPEHAVGARNHGLKTPNDRVEGRDAASSRTLPLDAVVGAQD